MSSFIRANISSSLEASLAVAGHLHWPPGNTQFKRNCENIYLKSYISIARLTSEVQEMYSLDLGMDQARTQPGPDNLPSSNWAWCYLV